VWYFSHRLLEHGKSSDNMPVSHERKGKEFMFVFCNAVVV
jgi:hypothetical protein